MTYRAPLSDEDLDGLLAACDPLDRAALQTGAVTESLVHLHDDLVNSAPPRRRRRSRPTRGRRLVVPLVAVGAAVAVALVGISGIDGEPSGNRLSLAVSPAAAATLDSLAQAARTGGAATQPLGPRQYEYLRLMNSEVGLVGRAGFRVRYRHSSLVQTWDSRDGANRTLTRQTSFSWLSAADRATYRTHRSQIRAALRGGPEPGRPVTTDVLDPAGDGTPAANYGRGLPSTPQALLRRLQAESRTQVNHLPAFMRRETAMFYAQYLFGELEQVLAGSTFRVQRAAAYIDVKYVPGVHVIGGRRDAIGRRGVAIELAAPNLVGANSSEFIVDATDGDLLQSEALTRRADSAAPANAVVSRQVFLQRAVVGSMQSLPDGRRIPFHGQPAGR